MVINSWVIAFNAPRTFNRCLPEGALMNNRVKHQRYPKKGDNTKCAASMKNTVLFPSSASLIRGSSVFFKGFLLVNISFGGNRTYFATSYANLSDKFSTCFSLRLSPVSFSIALMASLIVAGGCSLK